MAVLLGFGTQIGEVNVAFFIASHYHHVHAGHHGRGWVGAVRRRWNKGNLPLMVAPAQMVGPNHHQPRIFTLSSTVGLQGHLIKTCNLGQIGGQFVNHGLIPLGLLGRSKRVNGLKFRPT